eukprot:205430-Chlamydomonas_euryale.AAC.3
MALGGGLPAPELKAILQQLQALLWIGFGSGVDRKVWKGTGVQGARDAGAALLVSKDVTDRDQQKLQSM